MSTVSGTGTVSFYVSPQGMTSTNISLKSDDSNSSAAIASGTTVTDADGKPVATITCAPPATPAPVPPTNNMLSTYDYGPKGTRFNPAITITMKYDPAEIPAGMVAANLTLAFYDTTTGTWETLTNLSVDETNHTVSGKTTHFTQFAVLASVPAPIVTPTPTPAPVETPKPTLTPAKFAIAGLAIAPSSVKAGETVTVTASVTNSGGASGACSVILKVNGTQEATKDLTLAADATEKVSFNIKKSAVGTYAVDLNGQTGQFTVTEQAPETPPTGLGTTTIIIIVLVVAAAAGILAYFLLRKRHAPSN